MTVKSPQSDLPRGIRGGSDEWDGPAGQILSEDYFPIVIAVSDRSNANVSTIGPLGRPSYPDFAANRPAPPSVSNRSNANVSGVGPLGLPFDYAFAANRVAAAGFVKVWTGSAWVSKPVKTWDGSAWVTKPLKRWNGSAWV